MSDQYTQLQHRNRQDEEHFKVLFREYFASMCVFAGHYLDDEEMAKDVVHDVFCRIWEHPSDLTGVSNVKNYLYAVVKNRCLDSLRRDSIHHRYAERQLTEAKGNEAYFEVEVIREEVYRLLDVAIASLPDRSREILLLKLQGLKNQEIAEKLNISVNTVNTLKANAYKVLRDLLQDKYLICLLFFLKRIIKD